MREHALFIFLMIILGGCNDSKFDSSNSSASAQVEKEETSADSLAAKPLTETFELQAAKQPIDLVWVVDNSQSMIEENPVAQANLDAFVEKGRLHPRPEHRGHLHGRRRPRREAL